jgi:alpha-1,2-mannosyltransferase
VIRAIALLATVITCVMLGVSAWFLYWMYLERGQDWMVFYTAARVYFDGDLLTVLDASRFMTALNGHFETWLMKPPLSLHPWVYPPHFLMLFLPFGALPPMWSYISFMLLTFFGLILALQLKHRQPWLWTASIAFSPAAGFAVSVGQNCFLITALLVGGYAFMGTRPVVAGILFGALSVKPQFCLMVPVALVAASSWRVMFSAVATGAILCLISLAIFGPALWLAWLAMFTGRSDFFDHWSEAGRLNGMSVYTCAIVAGASQATARLAQIFAVLFAAGNVIVAFRRKMPPDLQLAVLLTCAFLAAPHVSNYDAVLLTVAATLVFKQSFTGGLPIWYMPLAGLVWLCPLINPPMAFYVGIFSPVLICLFLMALVVPHADWMTRPVALETS